MTHADALVKQQAVRLRLAADLLREKGHCKFALKDKLGRMCLVGALIEAGSGWGLLPENMLSPLMDTIREQFPEREKDWGSWGPADFNNDPDTTAGDVIAVLEKTAARLEEKVTG
jgi:hypothetical protein